MCQKSPFCKIRNEALWFLFLSLIQIGNNSFRLYFKNGKKIILLFKKCVQSVPGFTVFVPH